jgi:aspartate/methionine/tyrosine aminotransferase
VITFRPGWQQFWDAPAMLGCRVDVLDLAPDFSIDPDLVAASATDALRMIIVNSPGNPTGRRMPAAELAGLAAVAERHDAYLVLDQEYEVDLADCGVVRSDRVVSVSGLSKVFGFAGLRIGWMYGTPELMDRCADRKHLTTISNSVLCETLACEVLSRRDFYVAEYDRRVQGGLEIARRWADRHAGRLRLMPPDRTPFAWVYLDTGEPSLAFCRRVLQERVVLMPGETLGGAGGFRLGLSPESEEQLTAGLARIDYVLGQPHTENGVHPT